jgi:hypothetical protein
MRIIDLDASNWTSHDDLCRALFAALGAPNWHGDNVNALNDSMIWGGINKLEPPYTIRISGTSRVPGRLRDEMELADKSISLGREDFRSQNGCDIDVYFELLP